MINAIIIGRGGSTGLPGKNTMKILGRPLMHYPILAALYIYVLMMKKSQKKEKIWDVKLLKGQLN